MKLILDGERIAGREELLQNMEAVFDFPEWFGGNLDALRECLGDLMEEVDIELVHFSALKNTLGEYADRVVQVFQDAEKVNLNIRLILCQEEDAL